MERQTDEKMIDRRETDKQAQERIDRENHRRRKGAWMDRRTGGKGIREIDE